jgi:hypothetical protein
MANPPTAGSPPPAATPKPAVLHPATEGPKRVVIYQHSTLLYWWPVWLFAFLFALLSFVDGHRMAVVPSGTLAVEQANVEVEPGKIETRDVVVLPKRHAADKADAGFHEPRFIVSHYKSLGTTFLIVLLIVIFITNIPLRGLWSFVVVLCVVMLSIIFELAGFWTIIFERLADLAIFVNLGGYLLLGITLLALWLISFLFLDRQMYVIFTPGQVVMRLEIGGGEMIYSTAGMVVEKQRTDIFRHWILGFGSGDVVLRVSGLMHPIELHNVLNCDAAVRKIEQLMKELQVVAGDKTPASKP